MFNIALTFLLASFTVMVARFAYKKYSERESRDMKRMDEAERGLMKAEKEREKANKIEETGYSERDEYDDNDSDDDGE